MHFKKIKLMLKNSYKNAVNSKTQLIGVTVLAFLLSLVLTLVVALNIRVVDKYKTLNSESRVHDAIIDLNPYDRVITGEESSSSQAPTNLVEAQQYWVYKLQEQYANEDSDLQFDWSRTEAREFTQVKNKNNNITIKAIAKTTNKTESNDGVDKMVIFEGQDIKTRHQIVIDPNFAKVNNIKLGDVIRIQEDNLGDSMLVKETDNLDLKNNILEIEKTKNQIDAVDGIYSRYYSNYQWFQVVGYGSSSDFMTPIFSESSVLPNRNKEALLYVDPLSFGLVLNEKNGLYQYNMNANGNLIVSSNVELESFYSIKFKNPSSGTTSNIAQLELDFKKLIKTNSNNKIVYGKNDKSYRFASRIAFIDKTIQAYTYSALIIFVLIFFVCTYTIVLITKKQIENSSRQLGTMKALGYQKRVLVYNFIMLPFITAVIGGIIGYIFSIFISNLITNEFSSFFSLNFSSFEVDWISFLLMIGFVWIILTAISFTMAYILMKKSSLELISKMGDKKINGFKMFLRRIHIRNSFGAKLRKALLVDALGKMMAIGFVVLLASQLFTIAFAAPDILNRNKAKSFEGIKYKQVVEYSEPSYNNPLTFAKTFTNQDEEQPLVYSKNASGWTNLKLKTDSSGKEYGFDYDQMISDFYNGEINGKYYSIFIDQLFRNSGNEYAIPNVIELALANMKMLNLEGVIFDTNYFKQLAKYGIPAAKKSDMIANLLSPIILKQWFDYQNVLSDFSNTNINKFEKAAAFQTFYAKYTESIGLSITNDFRSRWPEPINDEEWIKMNQNDKVNIFNFESNQTLKNQYYESNKEMLKTLLDKQDVEVKNSEFKLTNDEFKMGAFRIQDVHNNDENALNDYYLSINFDNMDPNSESDNSVVDEALTNYWKWFTFLFYNRVDQSIIQTAYSRPPYFVKQSIANAYDKDDKNYSMAFNLVSYNKELETLGTKIEASKNGFDFKIYGIENDHRFLDLKDTNNKDLINELYTTDETNAIVINQSLAKTLNLKKGNVIDLDVMQNELQYSRKGFTAPYELDSWDTSGLWNGTGGFKQNSRMNKFGNILVESPGDINYSMNFLNSVSAPTQYYKSVLKGETILGSKTSSHKFKIVGIHDGYGQAQAWIKNEEAKTILQYDKVQEYMWKNLFTKQWNTQFGYTSLNPFDNKIIIEDKEEEQMKIYYKIKDFDLTKNGNDDLDLFKARYIDNPNANAKEKELAELIYQTFKNQYPVFNFKYSNKDDVGDLSSVMSVSSAYGDYSPTSLNGLHAKFSSTKESFDGTGIGTMEWILPIAASKEVLEQVSQILMLIIILLICLILLIAFVIILLTTSVIINDNIRFISTMRVLGYQDPYIIKTVMGMYLIVIMTVFSIGFTGGWFIFQLVIGRMVGIGLVLPLTFPIWLPFVVFLSIVGIYLIAIYSGYARIAKTNATKILQNSDI